MAKPRLQVALDTTDLDAALYVASQVIDVTDILEVGTPLLRNHGMRAIEAVRAKFEEAIIVADCKIMDYGETETKLAVGAGADGVIVQALAPRETIEGVSNTAQGLGAFAMIDCLGMANIQRFAADLHGLIFSHLIIHRSKDEQSSIGSICTPPALEDLQSYSEALPLAVAGGITSVNASELAAIRHIDILVVGQAIIASIDPRRTAGQILAAWE